MSENFKLFCTCACVLVGSFGGMYWMLANVLLGCAR